MSDLPPLTTEQLYYNLLIADINRQIWGSPVSPTTEGTTMTTLEQATAAFTEPVEPIVEQPTLQLRFERLEEEHRKLRYDLTTITARLVTEARNRGWCSEYDSFVRDTNQDTYGDWLVEMEREVTVTVSFEFDYQTNRTDDDVADGVRNQIRAILEQQYDQDEPHISVTTTS